MSPRLWLVRHAPPLAAQGLCYGRLNLPADAQATRDSARALAEALPQRVLALVRRSAFQRTPMSAAK